MRVKRCTYFSAHLGNLRKLDKYGIGIVYSEGSIVANLNMEAATGATNERTNGKAVLTSSDHGRCWSYVLCRWSLKSISDTNPLRHVETCFLVVPKSTDEKHVFEVVVGKTLQ